MIQLFLHIFFSGFNIISCLPKTYLSWSWPPPTIKIREIQEIKHDTKILFFNFYFLAELKRPNMWLSWSVKKNLLISTHITKMNLWIQVYFSYVS